MKLRALVFSWFNSFSVPLPVLPASVVQPHLRSSKNPRLNKNKPEFYKAIDREMKLFLEWSILCCLLCFQYRAPGNATVADVHPYYVSVTEIDYNTSKKEIEIACKIFTDDFEQTLRSVYNSKVDLYKPADKKLLDRQIAGYIEKHLKLHIGGKNAVLSFEGYEIEGEAAWCYFSVPGIQPFRSIQIFNDLLYSYREEQVNLVHVKINGERKSTRLTFPDTDAALQF